MRRVPAGLWLLLPLFLGCGSTPEAESEPAKPEASSGAELEPRSRMEATGIMGTIPERKILATLEPKLPSFQRCFERGAEKVEFISGRMEFYFRVGIDGRVEWVYPRASTVGHRDTERCLLEVAKAARFPEPKGGGAAELAWGFEIDALDSVRPPVAWDASRVGPVVGKGRAALAACDASGLVVTAYVAPGGQVLSAGGSAATRAGAEHIDCVLEAVAGWTLPDPGSYAAKVTFSIP
jgi:hypothetical protein